MRARCRERLPLLAAGTRTKYNGNGSENILILCPSSFRKTVVLLETVPSADMDAGVGWRELRTKGEMRKGGQSSDGLSRVQSSSPGCTDNARAGLSGCSCRFTFENLPLCFDFLCSFLATSTLTDPQVLRRPKCKPEQEIGLELISGILCLAVK